MNGDRGAKGSIKDRIISFLYRFRYNMKKKKQKQYQKENEFNNLNIVKNNETLTNIQNVNSEKYIYGINIKRKKAFFQQKNLESKEKIEKNVKSNNNKKIKKEDNKEAVKQNVLISNEPIMNDESKITILKEANNFIKKSIDTLNTIDVKIKDLKENQQNNQEIDEKYKALKNEISMLKIKYDNISEKYDLTDFSIYSSIKIMNSVNDYKSIDELNKIEMLVKVCKNEINKISGITIINEKSKKAIQDPLTSDINTSEKEIDINENSIENLEYNEETNNLEDINKHEENIKIKFNKGKEKIDKIDDIEEKISLELKEQQKIIDEMYKSAAYVEEEIRKKIEYTGYGKYLMSLLKIAGGILTIPFSGKKIFGIALGTTMINKGLKGMNNALKKKEKLVIDYKYEDISSQIFNIKDKISYTNLIIIDSLNEIKELKENFNEKFKQYNYILPEFNDIYEKLNVLEIKLQEEQQNMLKMDKKLDEEKEINDKKLEKIK